MNLNWLEPLSEIIDPSSNGPYDQPEQKNSDKTEILPGSTQNLGINEIGTTSGHPRRGMTAFGASAKSTAGSTSLFSKISTATGYPSSSSSNPNSPSLFTMPSPLSPSPSTEYAPSGPFSSSSSKLKQKNANSHYMPQSKSWFSIKSRTLYPSRDDPFHPELSSLPSPIASVFDLTDMMWEAAVEAVAWTVGVTTVLPVKTTAGRIERIAGGVSEWTGWGVRRTVQTLKRMTGLGGKVEVVVSDRNGALHVSNSGSTVASNKPIVFGLLRKRREDPSPASQ
jgi:hypothetical protein